MGQFEQPATSCPPQVSMGARAAPPLAPLDPISLVLEVITRDSHWSTPEIDLPEGRGGDLAEFVTPNDSGESTARAEVN
ncbi:unnamed protein product, partial [Iphiclides podalirius]